jgi:NTE family protein
MRGGAGAGGGGEGRPPIGPWEGGGGLKVLGARPWLVLGGGGLKGLGHAGAWQALQEAGFRPAGLVGTSIGAMVAAALAGGMGWGDLAPRAFALRKEDLVRVNRRVLWVNGLRASSVFQAEPLREYIERTLPVKAWDRLEFPLQINAVDLATGDTHWFGQGARTDISLAEAVYASCALPVLYPPAPLGDRWFVDGGAVDALPLQRAQEMGATGILALDAGSGGEVDPRVTVASGLVAIHSRIFSMTSGRRRREAIQNWTGIPLRLVRPRLDGYGSFDFQHAGFFLEEGYRATRAALHRWGVDITPAAVAGPAPDLPPLPAPGGLQDQPVDGLPHGGGGESRAVGEDTEHYGTAPIGIEVTG